MLLERDMLGVPLSSLVGTSKVVVFSDIYASRFFRDDETKDAYVINVLIEPASLELMHRNSKYMQGIPFEKL